MTGHIELEDKLRNEINAVVHEYRSRGYGDEVEPLEAALTEVVLETLKQHETSEPNLRDSLLSDAILDYVRAANDSAIDRQTKATHIIESLTVKRAKELRDLLGEEQARAQQVMFATSNALDHLEGVLR